MESWTPSTTTLFSGGRRRRKRRRRLRARDSPSSSSSSSAAAAAAEAGRRSSSSMSVLLRDPKDIVLGHLPGRSPPRRDRIVVAIICSLFPSRRYIRGWVNRVALRAAQRKTLRFMDGFAPVCAGKVVCADFAHLIFVGIHIFFAKTKDR